jgi:hypothetical protein
VGYRGRDPAKADAMLTEWGLKGSLPRHRLPDT